MFFGVFRLAKSMKFMNKGGFRCTFRSSRGTLLYVRILIIGGTEGG